MPIKAPEPRWMALALDLARRALGTTWPNPSVGCVIVDEQGDHARVLARANTAPRGRPHAETQALARAGTLAQGATAYISLEPCAHHGVTPPCAEALIRAGIGQAVIAMEDPDPRVAGRGAAKLKEAGIAVVTGLLEKEARAVNAGFLMRVATGRPLVTLKIAASLDGRLATHQGESRWITGEPARAMGHWLRATHDAVMIGSATALIDDPELSCRLPGLEQRSPVRVVADGRLRLPLTAKLVRDAKRIPTWVITRADAPHARRKVLEECGVTVLPLEQAEPGPLEPALMLAALGAQGLTRVLVEGGAHLAGALIRGELVDRLAWFGGNVLIGGDGHPAISAFGVDALSEAPRWKQLESRTLGADSFQLFEPVRG
jgi:diaminohydroxyphosphoribosylaminopyrimidine deaminase/5-amino-6-(5-phosphoribosylamino)uracil reductase